MENFNRSALLSSPDYHLSHSSLYCGKLVSMEIEGHRSKWPVFNSNNVFKSNNVLKKKMFKYWLANSQGYFENPLYMPNTCVIGNINTEGKLSIV